MKAELAKESTNLRRIKLLPECNGHLTTPPHLVLSVLQLSIFGEEDIIVVRVDASAVLRVAQNVHVY